MSAIEFRKHALFCNFPGRHYAPGMPSPFFKPPEGEEYTTTLTALRKLAAKAGWTHVPSRHGRKFSKDYCPVHKPQEAPEGRKEPTP